MKLSIFTPSNNPAFLPQVYASLRTQTDPDWQWTVVHNNGGEPFECDDERMQQHLLYKAPEWVGALKRYACGRSEGDLLLELDHDDLLMPTAVERVKAAFVDPKVGFVYSNTVYARDDWTPFEKFSEAFG